MANPGSEDSSPFDPASETTTAANRLSRALGLPERSRDKTTGRRASAPQPAQPAPQPPQPAQSAPQLPEWLQSEVQPAQTQPAQAPQRRAPKPQAPQRRAPKPQAPQRRAPKPQTQPAQTPQRQAPQPNSRKPRKPQAFQPQTQPAQAPQRQAPKPQALLRQAPPTQPTQAPSTQPQTTQPPSTQPQTTQPQTTQGTGISGTPISGSGSIPAPDVPVEHETRFSLLGRRREYLRRVKRSRRTIRHIDPWSVFKVSVLMYICLYVAVMLAGVVLWSALQRTGLVEKLEDFIEEVGSYAIWELNGDVIFERARIIGVVLAAAGVALNVMLAIIFNLISDLIGGIRVTILEESNSSPDN